jgi:hypothetical protein
MIPPKWSHYLLTIQDMLRTPVMSRVLTRSRGLVTKPTIPPVRAAALNSSYTPHRHRHTV